MDDEPIQTPASLRSFFVKASVVVESAFVLVSVVAAWMLGVDPWHGAGFDFRSLLSSIAATLPMVAGLLVMIHWRVRPFVELNQLLEETIGPSIRACQWYDFVVMSILAGLGEELLFRGVLQPLLGIVIASFLFGSLHWLNWAYAAIATIYGFYFGWLSATTDNLIVPIAVHAAYDLVAFAMLQRQYNRNAESRAESSAEQSHEN